ncbi:PDR/VanB family oxidoreductase [Halomonas sp. HG01]|uniref:PDR/VanB family oxidoreductase n=1 Tax=Halomonas sp. HG01 TaxID=1609967 RepID=UPI00061460FB|nr:PDR/VanB family oxidoreductase [Halomonas sp. HG01]
MSLSRKDHFELKVTRRIAEAKDVTVLELCDPNGRPLPSFSPGAHLEVKLNGSLVRHYSLLNDSRENHRYVIGVGLSAESAGGSSYIHGHVREGDTLTVSSPRNNFPLDTSAERYCFIAGGIGITPILSMVRWCINNGKEWRLFYTTRCRQRAAFYEELQSLGASAEQLNFHFNDEHSGAFLELDDIASQMAPDEHVYCCGPDPLMQNVKRVMTDHPGEQVHFEWFSAPEVPVQESSDDAPQDGFDVILRESGRTIRVQQDESILEALEDQGVEVPCSCRAGICRTCETTVISGTPDHRDFVLSEEEKASGDTMLICVSRAKSASLEIDL